MEAPPRGRGSCDFVIDTIHQCFLCLKITPGENRLRDSTRQKTIRTRSINELSTYLKMDMKVVFSGEQEPPQEILEKMERSVLNVSLCEGCYVEVGKFSKLYEELEKIQKKMGLSIDKVKKLMKEGEFEKAVCKLGGKRIIDLEDVNVDIACVLRKEVADKCDLELTKRLEEEPLPVENDATSDPSVMKQEIDEAVSQSSQDLNLSQSSQSSTQSFPDMNMFLQVEVEDHATNEVKIDQETESNASWAEEDDPLYMSNRHQNGIAEDSASEPIVAAVTPISTSRKRRAVAVKTLTPLKKAKQQKLITTPTTRRQKLIRTPTTKQQKQVKTPTTTQQRQVKTPTTKQQKPVIKMESTPKPETNKCDQCDQTFQTANALKGHTSRIHSDKRYVCDLCPKFHTGIRRVMEHRKEDHPGAPKPTKDFEIKFVCRICHKLFASEKDLATHKTQSCIYHIENTPATKNHRNKTPMGKAKIKPGNTPGTPRFVCGQCGTSVQNPSLLRAHITRVHLKIIAYFCDVCGKGFRYQNTMKLHKNSVHLNIKYPCEGCSKIFNSKSNKDFHQKSYCAAFKKAKKNRTKT